jgi:hypothetical protein
MDARSPAFPSRPLLQGVTKERDAEGSGWAGRFFISRKAIIPAFFVLQIFCDKEIANPLIFPLSP